MDSLYDANAASARLSSSRGYPDISPVMQLGNITSPGCQQNATLIHPGLNGETKQTTSQDASAEHPLRSPRLSPQAQTRSRVTAPTFRDVALDSSIKCSELPLYLPAMRAEPQLTCCWLAYEFLPVASKAARGHHDSLTESFADCSSVMYSLGKSLECVSQ